MEKSPVLLWSVLVLAGILATGCNKSEGPDEETTPPGVGTNEQTAMQYYATNDQFTQNDEMTFTDREIEPTDVSAFGSIRADILPLRFGRFVTSVQTEAVVNIEPGDSIAIVHVTKNINGVFRILGITVGTNDTVRINKEFHDQSERNVVFRRVARETRRYWRNWVPVATSLVAGGTINAATPINITKIEMFLGNGDTITVTDPTHYYLRYRWMRLLNNRNHYRADVPELVAAQRVTVRATVVSASPDTDLVVLRHGADFLHRRRARMVLISEVNNGGTYTREFQTTFMVDPRPGFFHAGVDAMTRETLFTDNGPYSVSWWGVPYRVF
jgi:hypothetical protein